MAEDVNLQALFDEYERTSKLTVLPEGKHKLKVTSCTIKNKGLQPVFETLEPTPGADGKAVEPGSRVMAGGIFPGDTDGGRNAFFRKLEKFGLTKEYFAQRPSLEDVRKALIGRTIEADLTIKEWNGEPRNELAFGIKLLDAPPLPGIGGVPQVTPAAAPTPEVAPPTQTPPPAPTGAPAADPDPGF